MASRARAATHSSPITDQSQVLLPAGEGRPFTVSWGRSAAELHSSTLHPFAPNERLRMLWPTDSIPIRSTGLFPQTLSGTDSNAARGSGGERRGRARANAPTRFHASYAPNDAAAARRTTASLTPPVRPCAVSPGAAAVQAVFQVQCLLSPSVSLPSLPVCRRRLNKRASAGCWFSGSNASSSVIGAPIFDESFSEAIDLIVN